MSNSNPDQPLKTLLEGENLLTFSEVGERLNIPTSRVSDLWKARKFLAAKIDGQWQVPELLFDGPRISKFASGAITVLFDGGYKDEEILKFLFTSDDTLPGRPIDQLHGHGAREVIRRAQAMAF